MSSTQDSTVVSWARSSISSLDNPDGGGSRLVRWSSQSTRSLFPQSLKQTEDATAEWTINKLDFRNLGFYARQGELAILEAQWDRAADFGDENSPRQLVLLGGDPGSGKTALTTAFQKRIRKKTHRGLFGRGKFEFHAGQTDHYRYEPYSGIARASSEICETIIELATERKETIKQSLLADLGAESLSLLTRFIPGLSNIVEGFSPLLSSETDKEDEFARKQFQFAFLGFLGILAKCYHPITLILDDLQAADQSSLDLLEVMLTDRINSPKQLMIVCTYRSNDKYCGLSHAIEEWKTKTNGSTKAFEMNEISVGNLQLEHVHQVVQDLLSTDNDTVRTMELAKICLKKTHGNVFFLLQYLSMLHERQLLQFNIGRLSWTWSIAEIEANTAATENVVDLLKHKMTSSLSKDMLKLLQLASCLGSTFSVSILSLLWDNCDRPRVQQEDQTGGTDDDPVLVMLDSLQKEGYVQSDNPSEKSFTWTHDNIREAATTTIPTDQRNDLAARVGSILIHRLNMEQLDSAVFVVVSLFNGQGKGSFGGKELNDKTVSRLELAQLNHDASVKAISLAAFESAAEYAKHGIDMLQPLEQKWSEHYELTLKLFSVGAKAASLVGDIDAMEVYCKEIWSQEERKIEDKLDAYNTWIDSRLNQGFLEEARELILDIMAKFGCRLPSNAVMAGGKSLWYLIKIKLSLKSMDVGRLAKLEDKTRQELMKLLTKLGTCCYLLGKPETGLLACFLQFAWTNKYGYSSHSCVCYASVGVVLTGVLDDIQGGSIYGQLALELAQKGGSRSTVAKTMFYVYVFIFPWTKPLSTLVKPLLEAYDVGMQSGDTESAMWTIYQWLIRKLTLGNNLDTLDKDLLIYAQQMQDLKHNQVYECTMMVRQVLLNLRGLDNSQSPCQMVGSAISEEDFIRYQTDPAELLFWGGALMTFFGNHTEHADWVLREGHDYMQKKFIATPGIMWDTYLKGVSCLAAAQETGKRKYKKMGKILRSKIKKWVNKGNPNVMQYESLLDAEWLALRGKKFAAIKQYEMAVLMAARVGNHLDAAFASERFGCFHQRITKDPEEASYRFDQAKGYWLDFGAVAKVVDLNRGKALLGKNNS